MNTRKVPVPPWNVTGDVPRLFLQLTAAIANASAEGDDRTVDLLLAAKQGAVRRHHELLAEGR